MTNPQIEAPARFIPMTAVTFASSDGSAITTSTDSPLPVSGTVAITGNASVTSTPAAMATASWSVGSTLDFTRYAIVRVQVDGLASGDVINFAYGLSSGGAFYPWQARDHAGNAFLGITAPGIYTMVGQGFITVTKSGSASNPVLTVTANA
jgi:hypothetical protein